MNVAAMPGRSMTQPFGAPAVRGAAAGCDWLTLQPGQVDIWVVAVGDVPEAALAAQYDTVLTEDERRQHGKFMFEKDRRRYLVTRSLTRYVLSRYLPVPPNQWEFVPTAYGRPTIANCHPDVDDLVFNISHSDGTVVLGLTRGAELGIDVEDIRRSVPVDVADSFFSRDEVRQLRALPAAMQPRRFLDFWTLKESYIKARGKGLSLPLDKFGFDLERGSGVAAYFDAELDDAPRSWTFWQWQPGPDSIAALCVRNGPAARRITVRRAIPFVREEMMAFDVIRMSTA